MLTKELHVQHQQEQDTGQPDEPEPIHEYIVYKVVNAIRPHIGAVLDTEEIRNYYESQQWNVTIT